MPRKYPLYLALALLLLATSAVYIQSKNFDYVSWDDPSYVLHNPDIQQGLTLDGVKQTFTSTRGGLWLPMVWLSYMVDIQLFGIDAGAQHIMNLFYHLINTLLIFLLLYTLTRLPWPSMLAAALFALHPLRVESVAWVTERKDMLSMLFFLLTLLAYAYYVTKPTVLRYLGVAGCYTLAFMSKPMVVTLPFVLLLLDYWPLQRLKPSTSTISASRLLLLRGTEKLPLLLLAAGISIATVIIQQQTGATTSFNSLPLWDRLGNAVISYGIYLEKTLLPTSLACFYPLRQGVDLTTFSLSLAVLSAITAYAISVRKSRPYVLFGWLWFCGTLFPVSGIAQAGLQAMADRFTYIPLTGIFIALAWWMNDLIECHSSKRGIVTVTVSVVVLILAVLSYRQTGYWENDKTLFSHAVAVTHNNYLAQTNLAGVLEKDNDLARAEQLATSSLRIAPDQSRPYAILGSIALKRHQAETAVRYFSDALREAPDQSSLHYLLGNAYMAQHRPDAAAQQYQAAVQRDNSDWQAHHRLGIAYAAMGELQNALSEFYQAARLQPDNMDVALSLALATEQSGDIRKAITDYAYILQRQPDNVLVDKRLSYLYEKLGNSSKAITYLRKAIHKAPNDIQAKELLQEYLSH